MLTLQGATEILDQMACANCQDKRELAIVPYRNGDTTAPIIAVLVLCNLCRHALSHGEIGANLEVRVAGQRPWGS